MTRPEEANSVATVNYRVFAVSASTRTTASLLETPLTAQAVQAVFGRTALRDSFDRGMADIKAGRFTIFDSVEELLRDLGE
jgi:predicted transcriptional regulator